MTWYVRADDRSCRVLGKLHVESPSTDIALQMARALRSARVHLDLGSALQAREPRSFVSHGRRHHGMSGKVQRFLSEPRYGPETAPCPNCKDADLAIEIARETGQMVEVCPNCGHRKLYRGRLTTD